MKTFLLLLSLLLSISLYSQSLTEQLGGITTNFTILSGGDTLNITDQTIIKRGLSQSETERDCFGEGTYGFGYGLGLQTYRLEFSTSDYIKTKKAKRVRQRYYEIKFYDAQDKLLFENTIQATDILKFWNGNDLYTYSLNLQNIPLVNLNSTERIEVTYFQW